ncbi:glycoside hydrolase family 88 protein [Falsirhodobacter deserti]|uniref:polygalacturonase PglA n=1 Tax=Falsirhodobacter deserti TaxID=1365611 RepID=UPI0019D4CC8A|nr:glycoside hydrolase family 88 protein [Falsirhodobacter deserti]
MTLIRLAARSARSIALVLPLAGARYHLPASTPWMLEAEGQPPRSGTTNRVVTAIHDLEPDTEYKVTLGEHSARFRTLVCAARLVPDLLPDLAEGDAEGAVHNAALLQMVVDGLPEGGTLHLPPGLWRTMPVRLKSNMTLSLAEGAVLTAPMVRDGWPVLPARDENGAMLGSWEGLPDTCFAATVHAIGATGLIIEGPGWIDGAGDRGDWWSWPKETREGARRPRGLHLIGCRDVTLLGFGIRNAPSWTIHPQGCHGVTAAALQIEAPSDSPNTDGFNPESCTNVVMEGIRFSVGDDCIAIKAGKRSDTGESDHLAETRGVAIRHCLMEKGHGGVVIGSEMSGGVHDVTVEDCEMIGTDRGLRLKTRRGRGGTVSGIRFARVRMDGVQTVFSANAFYHCDHDGHADWVQNRASAAFDSGTPTISGILVEDVEVERLSHAAGVFLGLPEAPIRDVVIRNLKLGSMDPAAQAAPPVMADAVRPMRHELILAENADVSCDDRTLLSQRPISLNARQAAPAPSRPPLDEWMEAYARDHILYKGGSWCYEDGCIYRGLDLLAEATGQARWHDQLMRLAASQVAEDGTLAGYGPQDCNIDNIMAGRVLHPLHRRTGQERFLMAAQRLRGQLDIHPRIPAGNYWHKKVYPHQVWLDGLYMALPFQIEHGLATEDDAAVADAVAQFNSALDLTGRSDGLYAHGYDDARQMGWADPHTGQSSAVWARAVGWLAMALVDALVLLPKDEDAAALRDRTAALLDRVMQEARPSGLWQQVLMAPDLEGNYEETSASAMFAYALLRAARHGIAPDTARQAGLRAFRALTDRIQPDASGRARLQTICRVAGLGRWAGRDRDGTPGYYLTEEIVADDAKGVGPFMMAAAEAHLAGAALQDTRQAALS